MNALAEITDWPFRAYWIAFMVLVYGVIGYELTRRRQ